jgi:nucleoside-triphosphatase THEP1
MPQNKLEVILITGNINSGKTTMLEKLFREERAKGKTSSGIIALGVYDGETKIGFNVRDLGSGCSKPLARVEKMVDHAFSAGKYSFSIEGFEFAKEAILNFKSQGVVFVDEVGPLELNDKGYADCLKTLIKSDISRLYIAIRSACVSEFIFKFLIPNMTGVNWRRITVPDESSDVV